MPSKKLSVSKTPATKAIPVNGRTYEHEVFYQAVLEQPIQFNHFIFENVRQAAFGTEFHDNEFTYTLVAQSNSDKLLKIGVSDGFQL